MPDVEFSSLLDRPLRNGVNYPARLRGEGTGMINMRELFAYDQIGDVNCERVPLTDRERETSLLEEGDLLFARQSLTYEGAGKVSIVMAGPERTFEGHLIRARMNRQVADPAYWYYFFKSSIGRNALEPLISQVAAAGIRGSDLAKLRVVNPALGTQRAIAEVLGALDDKIAANDAAVSLASELSTAIFEQGTVGCELRPVTSFIDPILGGTPARGRSDFWSEGSVPWVSVADVADARGGVITSTREHITELAAESTKAKPLPRGSVIVTARGTVGKLARISSPAAFNQSCYGFVPGDVPSAALYHSLEWALKNVSSFTHGSVFSTITKRTFADLLMPAVTSWSEIEVRLSPLHDIIGSFADQTERLQRLRDTLLPALMSGRIRVKDAEKTVSEVV